MATKITIGAKLAWKGSSASGQRAYIGRGDGANWGTRYKITTGSSYISDLIIRTYFYSTSGQLDTYPVRVGISTSSKTFLDANGDSGYSGTLAKDTSVSGYNASCTIKKLLSPNTTYYIFFYPDFTSTFFHTCHYDAGGGSYPDKTAIWVEYNVESTISASDANIGATSILVVNRKASAYTHTIQYQFGAETGYIDASGNVTTTPVKLTAINIGFTLPASWYSQIPNAKTGVCTLTLTTYSDDTQIGDPKTAQFTATASEAACKPKVSGTVVDTNPVTLALTGDENVLIRYFSAVLCTIAAEAVNGAYIKSVAIGGVTVSGTTRTIAEVETDSFVFTATDSRGYKTSCTVKKELIGYIILTNTPSGARTDPTSGNATLEVTGNYFDGAFSADILNTLEIKYSVDGGEYQAMTPVIADNKYTAESALSGLLYTESHTIEVVVTDALGSVVKTVSIGKGIPLADWGEDDYQFNVLLNLAGGVAISGVSLLDYLFPVGRIIEFYSHTSPASIWGGTWTRLENTFLWGTSSSGTIGLTGGSKTHALTVNELPSHSHATTVKITSGSSSNTGSYSTDQMMVGRTGTTYTNANAVTVTNGSAGGGAAHSIMPPHTQVSLWRRTA